MAATVLSPEDYYNLVLQKDSSQAIQVLERIPLDSRHPFVSFKNEKGEPRFRGQITLHAAVRAGHIQLVQLLLDSGSPSFEIDSWEFADPIFSFSAEDIMERAPLTPCARRKF